MGIILFFLFLVAAIAAGGWAYNKFGKSPCGCKDADATPAKL